MRQQLHFVVPGALNQRTGGYIYDRKIVESLRADGWSIEIHELKGQFPNTDDEAIRHARIALSSMTDGIPIIDGLALPAFQGLADQLPDRWIGLIHHPLALETGLSQAEVTYFAELEGRLMRKASRLIVTSPRTRRDLSKLDVDPTNVVVIEPGVEPAAMAAGSGSDKPISLLSVGTLTKRKGYPVLLNALALLVDFDWHLMIVGSDAWDPVHAAEIKDLVKTLDLIERVDIFGEQDEAGLSSFYHGADLFVLASHHEGYGMVLAEALARGLPIISTTAGAIPDTVPALAGKLVPPGDVEALAEAIRNLLTDPQLYRSVKQGAKAARNKLSDWEVAAGRFGQEIEKLIQA